MEKILTMSDLVKFCKKNKMYSFSSKESGKQIIVHSHQDFANVSFEEDETKLYAKVRVCHTLLNRNGSYISEENMLKAMPTLKYAPFLAAIHQLDDGTYDFHGHDMHIETDENGNETLVYDEQQVGTFTADEPYLEYDEEMDKTYVCAKIAIPKEYTRTVDILKEKGGTKVSCELSINELAYNAKEKYLELIDFQFVGCTALGREKDGTEIGEGMVGSKVCFEDFTDNALTNYQSQMIEFQARLEKLESACFNKDLDGQNISFKEGGNQLSKFEELLAKYNVTLEDITFEYEGLSDEDLEQKFAELFEDNSDGEEPATDGEGEPSEDGTTEDEPTTDGEDKGDEGSEPEGDDDSNFSVSKEELFNQLFEISFNEIHYALNALCSIYRNDSEWCYVSQVYEDYFIMEDWDSNKYYKQSYTKDGDNISLSGERIEMFAMLLTESEKISVEEMRSNYSALVEFKETVEKNELHSQKEALLSDEKYSILADVEAFTTLKKEMDNYSLTDLEKEAKVIYADHVSAMQTFSAKDKPVSAVKVLTNVNGNKSKKSRYGSLFSK